MKTPKEVQNLTRIRKVTEPLLRDGVTIADLVYRPCDMGLFGGEGYSLKLCKAPNKIQGIRFVHGIRFEHMPTDEEIITNVEKVLREIHD
jgi:hypothetical protein